MQIVSLYKLSPKSLFWVENKQKKKKQKNINLSSAELAERAVKVKIHLLSSFPRSEIYRCVIKYFIR